MNSPVNPSLRVAIYARVSSERQAQINTIASQIECLRQRVSQDGLKLEQEMSFIDDGYSGSTLVRPALEQLRDQAAAGAINRLYVHSPDRLSRHYAYQVLLVEELQRCGIELVFLNRPLTQGPEDDLLLQVQGVIAEYERAKIMERSRRGRQHAAKRGSVSVFGTAPYGYRYITRQMAGGEARLDVHLEEARVVRDIFRWIAIDRLGLNEVAKRLTRQGIQTSHGLAYWDRATIFGMLKNTAYIGMALYGKRPRGPRRPRLRPRRKMPEQSKYPYSHYPVEPEKCIQIPVPAIVDRDLFDAAQQQLRENQQRYRANKQKVHYLLQGLVVCRCCGYAMCGRRPRNVTYYRCAANTPHRTTGVRICHTHFIRGERLEQAVWSDAQALLAEPRRVEQEYHRRLNLADETQKTPDARRLHGLINTTQRQISRLIDAYGEGIISKEEFEPRLRGAREHLTRLQADLESQNRQESEVQEMRLVIGHLETFAQKMQAGLENADWSTRRDIIRTLVKKIEINDEEIKIVYRVGCGPFDLAPDPKRPGQDCWRRHRVTLSFTTPCRFSLRTERCANYIPANLTLRVQ